MAILRPKIIDLYLAKLYLQYFAAIFVLMIVILFISNSFDLTQRIKISSMPFSSFWQLTIYKIPYLISELLSLISFTAMLLFLKRLKRYHEIIAMLNAGISFWRIIVAPMFITVIIGISFIVIIGPIASKALIKYDEIYNKLHHRINNDNKPIFVFEDNEGEYKIIKIESSDKKSKNIKDINLLLLNKDLMSRIDAQTAKLQGSELILSDATVITDNSQNYYKTYKIKTKLDFEDFLQKIEKPERSSIWQLANILGSKNKSVDNSKYYIYFYKQIAKPFMMLATLLMAGCFGLTSHNRSSSQAKLLIIGLLIGFIVYIISQISVKLLIYNGLGISMAVFLPIFIIINISILVILHIYEI